MRFFINTIMKIAEVVINEGVSAEQLRIDALKRRKDAAADALKAERDRQKLNKARDALQKTRKKVLLGGRQS